MPWYKKFWNWLSGKKRGIALIYWSIVVPAMPVIWPEDIPSVVYKTVTVVGLIFTAVGLGHAGEKYMAKRKAAKAGQPAENGQ